MTQEVITKSTIQRSMLGEDNSIENVHGIIVNVNNFVLPEGTSPYRNRFSSITRMI